MRLTETKKFSDGRDATAFLAYCERLRQEKRDDGDVQICPSCEAEIWDWNRVYCSEACRKVAVEARRAEWKKELLKFRALGLTVADIMDRLGLGEHSVRYRFAACGIQLGNRQPQRVNTERRRQIIALRDQGMKTRKIAEKLGIKEGVVHGHLHRDRMERKRALAQQETA